MDVSSAMDGGNILRDRFLFWDLKSIFCVNYKLLKENSFNPTEWCASERQVVVHKLTV
jgi:hypothetical protein